MEQTPKASAMPLRIALILLPAPQLDAITAAAEIVNIVIDSGSDCSQQSASFESQLNAATNAINAGNIVKLESATHALLMLPALKAAQLRIHPHAQLAAMQQSSQTYDATQSNTQALTPSLALALAQAKRTLSDISANRSYHNLNSEQQFAKVCNLVEQLASRTHCRLTADSNIELGPKQAKSHYWFTEFHQNRVAAINFSNQSETTSYLISQGSGFIAPKSLLNSQRLLFILSGNSQSDIALALADLQQQLTTLSANEPALLALMQQNLLAANHLATNLVAPAYRAVLQASSVANLKLELNALTDALAALFEQNNTESLKQYKTPAGSYFCTTPLGGNQHAGLAFVYPGVGTVYADMLNELHQYFPALYAKLEREGDLKSMLQAEHIYHVDPKHAAGMSLGDLAIAGVGSSYLLTQLLTDEFNISPNFALGYSMGEASMWASLGVWQNPHDLIRKTQTDPLFTSAISGKLTAVRRAWQLNNHDADIIWNSFVVRSEAAPIQALLGDYPHAYLAIIQGDTCVIAGCEQQCRALLTALGKRGIAANRVTAMHTEPAMEEHHNVIDFYQQPLKQSLPTDIQFISAADLTTKQTVSQQALSSQVVAQSIADTFCQTLDFTALVHHAQNQGAKLFVEIGADRQNCTLIDKIAKQDGASTSAQHLPCCTVPINAKGSSDITSLLKALGQLISHKVPLSLHPFIDGLEREITLCQLTAVKAKMHTPIASTEHPILREEV
ncbi:PfaB family protein [Shewanella sp. 125m-7]